MTYPPGQVRGPQDLVSVVGELISQFRAWLLREIKRWLRRTSGVELLHRIAQPVSLWMHERTSTHEERMAEATVRLDQLLITASLAQAFDLRLSIPTLSIPEDAPRTRRVEELTFGQLYREVRPPSPAWLAGATIDRLGRDGWTPVFRVQSPRSRFRQDFDSLESIPPTVFDPVAKQPFEVDPAHVTMVLKKAHGGQDDRSETGGMAAKRKILDPFRCLCSV